MDYEKSNWYDNQFIMLISTILSPMHGLQYLLRYLAGPPLNYMCLITLLLPTGDSDIDT